LSTTGGKGQLFARLQSFESSQAKTASPSSSSSSPETVSGDKDVYEGDESSTGKRQPASKGRKPKKAMSTTRGKASIVVFCQAPKQKSLAYSFHDSSPLSPTQF